MILMSGRTTPLRFTATPLLRVTTPARAVAASTATHDNAIAMAGKRDGQTARRRGSQSAGRARRPRGVYECRRRREESHFKIQKSETRHLVSYKIIYARRPLRPAFHAARTRQSPRGTGSRRGEMLPPRILSLRPRTRGEFV